MFEDLLPTAKVDDNHLLSVMPSSHEVTHSDIDNVHSEVIAPVDERGSPLEFLDKVAEEMRLVRIVQLLDTPFGDYATIICLVKISVTVLKLFTG
jgi:hypothetical protein